jgi:hypothetical protein
LWEVRPMSDFDIIYLSIVLVAFLGFAGVLAYVSHRDRFAEGTPQPTNLPPI